MNDLETALLCLNDLILEGLEFRAALDRTLKVLAVDRAALLNAYNTQP